MPARAQHPFTLTTADDVANHTETLYWIESNGAEGFYAIPHTDNYRVSTTNLPNLKALWYFMDAGIENDTQYYYIVNHNTGYYLKLVGTNGDDNTIKIGAFGSGGDEFKFSIDGSEGQWVFYTKSGNGDYWVNKKGGNVSYDKYFKSSNYGGSPDENSKWNFVARNSVTWAHPFTNSTSSEKNYYLIHNATTNGSAFYMSIDDDSDQYATVSNLDNNHRIWYFMEADSDNTIPNLKYYYIVNAVTGKYLKFTGTADGSLQASSLRLYEHDGTETGETENRFQFMVLNAKGDTYSAIAIMPKLEISYYYNQNASLSPGDANGNTYTGTGSITLYNDMKIGVYNDRGQNNNYAHWLFVATEFYAVDAPTITNNNGTISLKTTTPGATIYYTINGDTPDNTSTEYSSPFELGNARIIKAIAYLDPDYSKVSTYIDYSRDYLTFNVLTDGTICWKAFGSLTKTIQYSINNGAWTALTSSSTGATISVVTGDVVRFKGSNTTYATSKSAYSGFDGSTATFNIEGNIMSLLYGDLFINNTTLPSTWTFCSLFKNSLVVSAENLILPATTLTADCYRAMFSMCTTLVTAPQLPATTLASECYWYMFECCAITTAPDLLAATLVDKCYGHMFVGCTNLNYIKCLAISGINGTNLERWVGKKNAESSLGVAGTGTFVKDSNADWSNATGTSGIPSGWTINNYVVLYSPEISCDGEYITMTCTTEGASIYYRLNQTGDFSLYSSPIEFNSTTTVEAYSTKDGDTSDTVIITFEKYDNPFDESNRLLDSWSYGGAQVTLPYSVNGMDGHSSSYSKGTHTFETTITLYKEQPTYLWFQHADQSADIYVDDTYVTTHWGGYNAFFADITNYVHIGTNRIKVVLNNTTRNTLAPCDGDFNFNATLGKAKLFTSPVVPSMDYGYDGFHITSSVTAASATINIKTSIPVGASVVCTISDGTYNWTETQNSTGDEQTFTTTIQNPHLWNGTADPHLYNVKLEIYKDNELYHRYERPYGFRYYEYVINEPIGGENYTGFLLNGSPYLLRGVCMHDDLEGKANALNDDDYAQEFAIIQDLGCNFIRLAHYPHPKEVYDWCDRLGIIVQTEVPCVKKLQSTMPTDYYDHLYIQYEDMVRQHFNHPCIVFWGLSNETTTDDKEFGKTKIEAYTSFIKGLDSERLVGYVMSHSWNDPSGYYEDPENVDWFGCNIYTGWYHDKNSNNPTSNLNTRLTNTLTQKSKPLAFSEYGCGGTPSCHSDDFMTTTTRGNNPRHDIEYQMWLHEGHIAAIKNFPQLLFTSQWQLFDIAVSGRNEGYTVCLDGENTSTDDNLRYLNNKGLVERDHKTKKDTYYLYKAWWNPTDKFVHICGKNYEKLTNRVIKCYTNDTTNNCTVLSLYVNGVFIETAQVDNNIATFTARTFNPGDVVRVNGATANDTFTFSNIFINDGNWNEASNWKGNAISTDGSDAIIRAECTIPNEAVARANNITLDENGSLTVADGGQLYHNNEGVIATVEKTISAYSTNKNGWYLIGYSSAENGAITEMTNLLENEYDLYYYDEPTHYWRNYKNTANDFTVLEAARGYLYANDHTVTLGLKGTLNAGDAMVNAPLSYTPIAGSVKGFNLVGNPYAHNVTSFTGSDISSDVYRMNGTRTDLMVDNISDDNPLKPGEGFFVKAIAENASIIFNSGAKGEMTKTGRIILEISKNNQLIDRLIVKLDGEPLEKLMLNENSTKIFATRDQQDWAVVTKEGNEQTINFEAAENGIYTITVNTEDMDLSYLHLIDNIMGTDVNLLQTPAYSFNAMTTDYANRFKLVFVCRDTNDDEPFAFINNGNIIITTDVEGATLEVIDVMGRVIISRNGNISGNISTSGMTPGTYVLRLINADKVMTQKIVIK